MSTKPILSVCLPTYNRAQLLKSALLALIPQINALSPEVELLVSDNASTDETQDVIAWAATQMPLRHRRNESNEGYYGNLYRLTGEMAQGEYVWVIGDDDLVRPDGLQRIVNALKAHPDTDFLFVNLTELPGSDLSKFDRPVTGADFPQLQPTRCADLSEHAVGQWDELIDPQIDNTFLGSVQVAVFRLNLWKAQLIPEKFIGKHVELGYYGMMLMGQALQGKKAYYLGYPCIITFFGQQEWMGYLPTLILFHVQNLLDSYRKSGVDSARIERCREDLIIRSYKYLNHKLAHPEENREVKLWRFLWQTRQHFHRVRQMIQNIRESSETAIRLPLYYHITPHGLYDLAIVLYVSLPEPIKRLKRRFLPKSSGSNS